MKGLDFFKQIDKMDKNNRLLSVVKAFSEIDLDPTKIDNMKMGYIFEGLIRKFSENAEAGGRMKEFIAMVREANRTRVAP